MDIIITCVLATALIVATITDIRSQRIYNWLTFPLMFGGFAMHTALSGLDGLALSAGGFGIGLLVMIVPFFMGVMGAGDVKLMAAIGAWLGAATTFTAFLFTCLAGGVYALIVLMQHREHMRRVFANLWHTFLHMLTTRSFDYTPTASEKALPRLCYGVAIAAGTVITVIINYVQTGSVLAN